MQPPENQDHYRVLQITQNATVAEIKAAYRRLAFVYHPDKEQQRTGNKHANAEKFRRIQAAQEILCDENKRRTYDLKYAELCKEWVVYKAWQKEQRAAGKSYASSSSSKATSDDSNEWDESVARCTQTLLRAEAEVKRREMEHQRKTLQAQQALNDLESQQDMVDALLEDDLVQITRDIQKMIAQMQVVLEFKLSQRRLQASNTKFDLKRRLWRARGKAENRAKAERIAIERAKADAQLAQAELDSARAAKASHARQKAAQEAKERAEAEAKQNRAEKERLAEERSREAAKRREAEEEKAAMERLRKEQERERLEEERLQEAAEKLCLVLSATHLNGCPQASDAA